MSGVVNPRDRSNSSKQGQTALVPCALSAQRLRRRCQIAVHPRKHSAREKCIPASKHHQTSSLQLVFAVAALIRGVASSDSSHDHPNTRVATIGATRMANSVARPQERKRGESSPQEQAVLDRDGLVRHSVQSTHTGDARRRFAAQTSPWQR